MGLNEQILAGAAALKRENIIIPIETASVQYTGSIEDYIWILVVVMTARN
jgi:hypothetical protein